jgi:hypothetical protein
MPRTIRRFLVTVQQAVSKSTAATRFFATGILPDETRVAVEALVLEGSQKRLQEGEEENLTPGSQTAGSAVDKK